MESFLFLQERKRRQVSQLILLNNLKRGDQNIASTMLITLLNRLVSSCYDDKMQVKFLPSQGIQQEQLDAYNVLAQSDYLEMEKAKLDYDLVWDTLAFGDGWTETLRFNKKRKIMEPCVINPLMFGYDPYFENPQEWRYYWKWITKSKWELKKLIDKKIITGVTKVEEIPAGIDPYLWDYKARRDAAKKTVEPPITAALGDVYQILEMFGYDENGDKCVYWYDKGFSKELYKEKLDLQDGEDGESKWPIVRKQGFREPHSSVPISVLDLLEDKHRAKSVLLNLAFIAAKDRANPLYWYDPDKVADVTQFLSRQINQHIRVTGNGAEAVGPINTQDPMSAGLIQFISMITTEANDPIGTGLTGQPHQDSSSDTATEAAITQQMNDMAQSLISKVMQFGEAEFWSHWFHRYARNSKDLGEKMANVVGVKGIDTKVIDLGVFQTDYPPGVLVYSAKEAQYKDLVKRRDFMQLYPNLQATLDADGMRNFNKHVFFPLFLEDPSLIETLFPPTLDEQKAESENELLKQDEHVPVSETDDHTTHIYVHQMVQPKTWALWFHLREHQDLLAKNPPQNQSSEGGNQVSESMSFKDLPPDGQVQMAAQAGIKLDGGQMAQQVPDKKVGGKVSVGAEKKNPQSAASPLKSEIKPKTVTK